jgi:hypothetical protein
MIGLCCQQKIPCSHEWVKILTPRLFCPVFFLCQSAGSEGARVRASAPAIGLWLQEVSMGIRSLVLVSFVTAFSLAASARADVPNPSTGSGGSSSSSSSAATSGAGAGSLSNDPNCSVNEQQTAGLTCELCATAQGTPTSTTPACSSLDGNTFSVACQQTNALQVWCNGPSRLTPSDQNVATCTVATPGGALSSLGACGALAAAAALLMRRRRRS